MEGIVQLFIPAGTVQIFSISVLPVLQPLINCYISSVPISTAFDGWCKQVILLCEHVRLGFVYITYSDASHICTANFLNVVELQRETQA